MPPRSLILVAIAIAGLTGCGRRGALEEPGAPRHSASAINVLPLPPERAIPESEAGAAVSTPVGTNVMLDPSSPGAQEPEVTRRDVPMPQRRFILDPLL